MIGWNISVYKLTDGGHSPAAADSGTAARLAIWQTNEYGLGWLKELAAEGKAINLGGDGYPNRFTAQAEYLVPRILDKAPGARDVWHRDEHDIVLDFWAGKTTTDRDAARQCRFDEWLMVEAWDES